MTIKVVCCDPEKIRDKLCCKGGGAIKSIKIVQHVKWANILVEELGPNSTVTDEPKQEEKMKPDEPKQKSKKTKEESEKKKKQENQPRSESPTREKSKTKPKGHVQFAEPLVEELGLKSPVSNSGTAVAALVPAPEYLSLVGVPFGMNCVPPYYEGRSGGPWSHGYYGSQPLHPLPTYYGGYYGKVVYDSYGGSTCYVNRCDKYDAGEGATSECSLM